MVGPGSDYDFNTIQAGIDAAVDGDTVLVAPGEYVITEPISFRGKAITVGSEAGSDQTTIRMGTPADVNRGSVVIFENNETTASVLEGFTITAGKGYWVASEGASAGGGIFFDASSGTVRDCAIVQNSADAGGGIASAYACSPKLIDCIIAENSAAESGGGVFAYSESSLSLIDCIIAENSAAESGGGVFAYSGSSLSLFDCTIVQNRAESGGGVLCFDNSSMAMSNCDVRENIATGTTWFVNGYGGALDCAENSSMTIDNCTFEDNSTGVGGGVLFNYGSSVTMTNCAMIGNTAHGWGGAIQCLQASTVLTNCVIARNSAGVNHGGLHVEATYVIRKDSSMVITNCTIWGNSVGGAESDISCVTGASATITDSIIRGNTPAGGPGIRVQSSSSILNISYCNIAGGQAGIFVDGSSTLGWGEGNIDADPYFADPDHDDFHLKSEAGRWDPRSQIWVLDDVSSPCIDAGDPNSPVAFEPYPNGMIINMGAYGGTAQASQSPSGLHSKYGGGTGEPNDPYLLYTDEHLNALGAEPNDYDKHFKLMADIDLSGYVYDRAVIAPNMNDDADYGFIPDFDGIRFTGVFDGNGHTISHLTIEGISYLGLFGQIGSGASISNLGLEAVDVNGMGYHVGGIVGSNGDFGIPGGSITNSYSTGAVSGNRNVGGLVGWQGQFLVGQPARVADCFSNSTVTGGEYVGGLVGMNYDTGSITNSYSTGAVSGDDNVGGLVGGNWGSITSSVWDVQTSGLMNMCGRQLEHAMGCDDSFGKTTTEMKTAATFLEAGWDFVDETENGTEDIWWINEGRDYPRLWWELQEPQKTPEQ